MSELLQIIIDLNSNSLTQKSTKKPDLVLMPLQVIFDNLIKFCNAY